MVTHTGDQELSNVSRRCLDKIRRVDISLYLLIFSILAHLKHPHVVSLQESFFDPSEEKLFIVQVLVILAMKWLCLVAMLLLLDGAEFDVKNNTDLGGCYPLRLKVEVDLLRSSQRHVA